MRCLTLTVTSFSYYSHHRFKAILPNQCALLRSKVFPNDLSVDTESGDTDVEPIDTRPDQNGVKDVTVPTGVPLKKSLSRAPSNMRVGSYRAISREPSIGPKSKVSATLATARSLSRAPSTSRTLDIPSPTRSVTSTVTRSAPSRSRSQSTALSESLAQEQREKLDRMVYGVQGEESKKKRKTINREVSMSRNLKRAKSKIIPATNVTTAVKEKADDKERMRAKEKANVKALGVTLVEETPAKPRVAKSLPTGRNQSQARIPSLNFGVASIRTEAGKLSIEGAMVGSSPGGLGDDEDEEWMMDSSPDIRLFNPSSGSSEGLGAGDADSEDEETHRLGGSDADIALTPSKPKQRRFAKKRQ